MPKSNSSRQNNEWSRGEFRALSSLYISGCLVASAIYTLYGESIYPTFHIIFLSLIFCLLFTRGFVRGLFAPLATRWSAACLAAFIAYWLVMGLTYSDQSVGARFAGYLLSYVTPGFLLGYVAFANYQVPARILSMNDAASGPNRTRIGMDALALVVHLGVLVHAFVMFVPRLRPDFFLVNHNLIFDKIHQVYGVYLILGLVVSLYLIDSYVRHVFANSQAAAALWAVLAFALSASTFLIAQILGSNSAAALSAAVGIALAAHMCASELGRKDSADRSRLIIMMSIFFALSVGFLYFLSQIPPFRLLNFEGMPVVLEESGFDFPRDLILSNSSVSARVEIFSESFWQQIMVNPVFGDIAVGQAIGRPGLYLHSILAVQTHFGLIGSILFFSFLGNYIYRLYTKSDEHWLKFIFFPLFLFACAAVFFTWIPLWFLVGAIYAQVGYGPPKT